MNIAEVILAITDEVFGIPVAVIYLLLAEQGGDLDGAVQGGGESGPALTRHPAHRRHRVVTAQAQDLHQALLTHPSHNTILFSWRWTRSDAV